MSGALSSVLFLPLCQFSESWLSASFLSFYSLLCLPHGWKSKTRISWRLDLANGTLRHKVEEREKLYFFCFWL